MVTDTVGVIPARMDSSRYPGKPLVPIQGLPMVEHVYRRSKMSDTLDAVFVATCDDEIREAVDTFGGKTIMTSNEHKRASDRVAEAAVQLDAEIVVMIQGDEPMVTPKSIDLAVAGIKQDTSVGCVNLIKEIDRLEEFRSPHTIKVVKRNDGRALYFSRTPIPATSELDWEAVTAFKQVCIIPFQREVLMDYRNLPPTLLEQSESVDMLRLLEHGYEVGLIETDVSTHAVDVPADRDRVDKLLSEDPLTRMYT